MTTEIILCALKKKIYKDVFNKKEKFSNLYEKAFFKKYLLIMLIFINCIYNLNKCIFLV
jgi:hypothetical protein